MKRPYLQDYKSPAALSEYPTGPCFKAGHLVSKNAGWRNRTPVIAKEQCKNCLECYMYCPDGVIYKEAGKVAVDYDFCKGCGICAQLCKFGAIEMKEGGTV